MTLNLLSWHVSDQRSECRTGMDRAGDAFAIRSKSRSFSVTFQRGHFYHVGLVRTSSIYPYSFATGFQLFLPSVSLFSSGPGGLQRRLEQSVWACGIQNAGRMHPPLPSSAHRRPLPGRLVGLTWPAGVPASAFQPIGQPRHEHRGLPGICSGPAGGVVCSKGRTGWEDGGRFAFSRGYDVMYNKNASSIM